MALTLLRVERNLLIALDLSWLSWLPSDKSLFQMNAFYVDMQERNWANIVISARRLSLCYLFRIRNTVRWP